MWIWPEWLINNRNLFPTVLEAGNPGSGCHAWLGGFQWGPSSGLQMATFALHPHLAERERERERALLGSFLIRALIPFMRVEPSWPNHFPKTPPPIALTLGVRISTEEFGRDTNIQFTASPLPERSATWEARSKTGCVSREFRTWILHSCRLSETRKPSMGNVILITTTWNCSVMWS